MAKFQETWEYRKAIMHPQHSRIEHALLLKLHAKGLHPMVDKEFCVQATTPDFYFPDKNLAIYIDGKKIHSSRIDRDEELRGLLEKRHGVKVLSLSYDDYTEAEVARLLNAILEVVK